MVYYTVKKLKKNKLLKFEVFKKVIENYHWNLVNAKKKLVEEINEKNLNDIIRTLLN